MDHTIQSMEQLRELWTKIYNDASKPDWSHIIPYYAEGIHFRDSVQELHGLGEFRAMTERLVKRSGSLEMTIRNSAQAGRVIFLEWTMTLQYKRYPTSSVYGCSRVSLDEAGKIIEQRDYYDLWGDIFDNVPFLNRPYRAFMRWKFG